MQAIKFMDVHDHFSHLLKKMTPAEQTAFSAFTNVRVETAYRTRHFIVYHMVDGSPCQLDRIVVKDFHADHEFGATTELTSTMSGMNSLIGYTPQLLFDFPVFVWLPLHSKVRWGVPTDDIDQGSLGFPICIRTKSRRNLREEGVVYCETAASFGKEFDRVTAA